MKYNYLYVIGLFAVATMFTSCEHQEPDVFSQADNGVYFNYDNIEDLTASRNFGDYILETPDTLGVPIKVRLLGHLSDRARTVILKGRTLEGYQEAAFDSLPQSIVFEAGEYEKTVHIFAKRPEVDDTQFAIELYLESQDETIGSGIEGFETFSVYVSNSYTKPQEWDYYGPADYFGEWSKEKHIYLTQFFMQKFEITDYVSAGDYYFVQAYSMMIDYLRNQGEQAEFEIPYYFNSNYAWAYSFNRPAYWTGLHDKYIVNFKDVGAIATFVQLAQSQGLTTKTEAAYFSGDEARMKEIHQEAVALMQTLYDNYFLEGKQTGQFAEYFYVPLLADMEYNFSQPLCWSPSQPESTALLEHYYGAYSQEKLQFMVKTTIEQRPELASLAIILPTAMLWDDKAQMYVMGWGEYLSEEDWAWHSYEPMVYELNQLFRAADTENVFNFPEVAAPGTGGQDDDKKDDKK